MCAADEGVKVDTSGDAVEVEISRGCPSESHVLVVVQELGSEPRPLGSYSVEDLVELTMEYSARLRKRQSDMQTDIYIAANITRGMIL